LDTTAVFARDVAVCQGQEADHGPPGGAVGALHGGNGDGRRELQGSDQVLVVTRIIVRFLRALGPAGGDQERTHRRGEGRGSGGRRGGDGGGGGGDGGGGGGH